jgi:DNA-damage-inducible protein J
VILLAKTATVVARVEVDVKQNVESIFKSVGLTTSEAVNLFYHQVLLNKGLPFEVKVPNSATLQVFKDTDEGKNLNTYDSAEEMLSSLKKQC